MTGPINLVLYLIFIVPAMLVGFVFARRKMFVPFHKLTMTAITLTNWVLIVIFMSRQYARAVVPELPDGLRELTYLLPTLHLLIGGIAQLVATYLVIRMWIERTPIEKRVPRQLLLRRIKPVMCTTLALWLITAALGLSIYLVWYVTPVDAGADSAPATATEETAPTGETLETPVVTEEAAPAAATSTPGTMPESPTATEPPEPEATEEPVPATTEEAGG